MSQKLRTLQQEGGRRGGCRRVGCSLSGRAAVATRRTKSTAGVCALVAVLVGSLGLAQPVSAQPLIIVITDLGTLGGDTAAVGISDGGHVAGFGETPSGIHAFFVSPLDTNADGVPDTWFQDLDGNGANDLMVDLGTLGGDLSYVGPFPSGVTGLGICLASCLPGGRPVTHKAVNGAGEVVGTSDTLPGPGDQFHAFFIDGANIPPGVTVLSPGVMEDIHPGGFGATWSTAVGINSLGWIIGYSDVGGFLWKEGTWTFLGDFIPMALNDLDPPILAGILLSTGAPARWAGGIAISLPTAGLSAPPASLIASPFPGVEPVTAPTVTDINNLGWIVGTLSNRPVLWKPCLVCFPVPYEAIAIDTSGFFGFDVDGIAVDVNDAGQVVGNLVAGTQVFRWENGIAELGVMGHAANAVGVNDLGQIVVNLQNNAISFLGPLLWLENGEIELGDLLRPGGTQCCFSGGGGVAFARAINNREQVVGASQFALGVWGFHAALWTILTPSAAASQLATKVGGLQAAGAISPGQATALEAKANAAGAILGDANLGNDIAACRLLKAFINQVEALQNAGILTTDQANSLVADAMNIMNAVPCPA